MKKEKNPPARLFVCVYEKDGRCKSGVGEKCASWIKEELKAKGLKKYVWATRSLCQGYCNPDGTSATFIKSKGKAIKQYSGLTFDQFQEKARNFIKSVIE